jgi:hypothetical protein
MQKDSVDFDFFDTPREEQQTHFVPQVIVKKRPPPFVELTFVLRGLSSSSSKSSSEDPYE